MKTLYNMLHNILGTEAIIAKFKLYLFRSSEYRQRKQKVYHENRKALKRHLHIVKKELRKRSSKIMENF